MVTSDDPDSHDHPRETDEATLKISAVRFRRDAEPDELRLKAHLAPLRLHIDQDTLDVAVNFFSFVGQHSHQASATPVAVDEPPFIQSCDVYPLLVTLDYKPKRLDVGSLTDGNVAEVANLFHLTDAKMEMGFVRVGGISGWARLVEEVARRWLPHVLSSGVPGVVKGVAPIRSVVNIGTGVADLVLLPIEQFNRDGKIVRGIQKGAMSFVKLAGVEVLNVSSNIALGTQALFQRADEMLAGDRRPSASDSRSRGRGLDSAPRSIAADLREVASTIVAIPVDVREAANSHGIVEQVVRVVPLALVRPAGAVAGAVSSLLQGLKDTVSH
ncbi:hypothetical protein DFJ74DRAFT_643542 [Hyaloraphidium curvatum]|nr:hypothetical protein DFJ74DRAFT_643542 [Hyaloraphidium curvatum]